MLKIVLYVIYPINVVEINKLELNQFIYENNKIMDQSYSELDGLLDLHRHIQLIKKYSPEYQIIIKYIHRH